jgi:hypothetical protein
VQPFPLDNLTAQKHHPSEEDVVSHLDATEQLILNRLAEGKGYDAVLSEFPHLTLFNISDCASSVVQMTDVIQDERRSIRPVFVLMSEGYGLDAIARKLGLDAFRIQQAAWVALECDRLLKRKEREHKPKGFRALSVKYSPPLRAGEPWTKEEEQRMVALHRKGMSVALIAREIGRRRSAIRARLKKVGIVV